MASNQFISIIVPIRDSSENLSQLLLSLTKQTYLHFEVIINDDKRSTDPIAKVVDTFRQKGLTIVYLQKNTGMSQARKEGAKHAKGGIFIHLDADMRAEPQLLQECAELMNSFDALVIPEESIGTTFWAKCKWLEKKCYDGVEQIESLRVLKAHIYHELGGHDEELLFSEDKDLDIRVKKAGYKVGRTSSKLFHNEGNLSLIKTCLKKLSYAPTANKFFDKHPAEARWQTNIINRYILFFKNIHYFFKYPLIYIGMIFMKTSEFGCAAIGLVINKVKNLR